MTGTNHFHGWTADDWVRHYAPRYAAGDDLMTGPFSPLVAPLGPIGWVAQPVGHAIAHAIVDPHLTPEQRARVARDEQRQGQSPPIGGKTVRKAMDTTKYVAIAVGVVAVAYMFGPAARSVGSRL